MNACTRFFLQHDRLHTFLTATACMQYLRAPLGHLAAMRLEGDDTSITMLGGDLAESVLLIVAAQQQVSVAYCVYGASTPPEAVSDLPAFNGQRLLNGLYLLGNGYRGYNARLMRFQSPDTLSPFEVGGLNAYAYCAGDPVNLSDRSGHMRTPTRSRSPSPSDFIAPPGSPRVADWDIPFPRDRSRSPVRDRSRSPVRGPSAPTTARPPTPDVPGEGWKKPLTEHEERQRLASNIAASQNTPSTLSSVASSFTGVHNHPNDRLAPISLSDANRLKSIYPESGRLSTERNIVIDSLQSGSDARAALRAKGFVREAKFVQNMRYRLRNKLDEIRRGN